MDLEVFPHISVERSLGDVVSFIDVDHSALVELMRARGFNDEQIANTVITVKANKEYSHGACVTGRYYPRTEDVEYFPEKRDIEIYPIVDLEESNSLIAKSDDPSQKFNELRDIDSLYYSCTLAHELEHKAIRMLESGAVKSKYSLHTGRVALKGLAMMIKASNDEDAAHWLYWSSPEEIQCRMAENKAPKELVIIEPKCFSPS